MLKEETVTGTNARRVMNGEAPVEESRGEDEVTREKELTQAYFQLSLVDHYSIKEGALVGRVLDEELRTNYKEAMESFLTDHAASKELKESKESRELEKMLASFTVRDRKRVLDKYSVLLYNHSLEKINVEEMLDRLKEKQ